mmetsp:Transcript_61242/g.97471  ORF Transcript_61242/g.97471 Transcript_61242/m.97471 type:complete len:294 (+) Transcript_61242:116-997(+)
MPPKKRSRLRGYNYGSNSNNFSKRKRKTERVCGWYACEECDYRWESGSTRILKSSGEVSEPEICECGHSVFPYKVQGVTNQNRRKVLKRAYGEFECDKCGECWASPELWIVSGSLVAWYPEKCNCAHQVYPYEVYNVRGKSLERAFGYFECDGLKCGNHWTSAYSWRVKGTQIGWYRQGCLQCGREVYPYRLEENLCQTCLRKPCECDRDEEDEAPKKPHIQRLCEACRYLPVPCSQSGAIPLMKYGARARARSDGDVRDDDAGNGQDGDDYVYEDGGYYIEDGNDGYADDGY